MTTKRQDLVERAAKSYKENGRVDVIKLASALGIEVFEVEAPDSFNATIEKENGGYSISVNTNHPVTRQRFSVAHEIAHFAVHKKELDKAGSLNRDANCTRTLGNMADDIAAEILIPKVPVDEFIRRKDIDITKPLDEGIVFEVARKFRVSLPVAAIRLRTLKYYVPFYTFA